MISFLLRALDLFKPLFKWQGVNYDQLRTIVGVKLVMDNRRSTIFRNRNVTTDPQSTLVWMFIVYGITGGLISFAIALIPSLLFSFTLFFSYFMVMIILTLVSDFSSVLLDTSDNTIILPRPIDAKTFYASRTTHILLYILQIATALALIPVVVTFAVHGVVVGFAAVVAIILSVGFSVAITNGMYLLLMQFTSQERLKNIINAFQIGMSMLVMGGYQIIPRLFDKSVFTNAEVTLKW